MSRFVRTYQRRKKFLDELAAGSSISMAARAADGTTRNFKNWRDTDPEFAKDWDDAIEEGTDFIEDVATERAMRKSDPLMLAILKARRPDKYDRNSGKNSVEVNINVEGAKAKLLNRLARLQAEGKVLEGVSQEEPEVSPDKSGEGGEEAPTEQQLKLLPAPTPIPERGRKRRSVEQPGRRKTASA